MIVDGPADLPPPPRERMTFAEYIEWQSLGLPELTPEQAKQSAAESAAICEEIKASANAR